MKWIALTMACGIAALAFALDITTDDRIARRQRDAGLIRTSTTYRIESVGEPRPLDGSDLRDMPTHDTADEVRAMPPP